MKDTMLEVEGVLSIDKVNPSLIKSLMYEPQSETAQEYHSRSFYIFSLCVFSLCDNKGDAHQDIYHPGQ